MSPKIAREYWGLLEVDAVIAEQVAERWVDQFEEHEINEEE